MSKHKFRADEFKGGYKLIPVEGEEMFVEQKPSIGLIQKAIGCDCCDTVTLDRGEQVLMIVDDTGMVDGKPVNRRATALAQLAFGPQYPYSIHGDVAVVWDGDFE